ncbi:DUF5360 family protein [Solihabitans fulvus]|uniref:DUF5360 family protein n=1 Tax=Solihabitans fulvus TaxID=1892852 RepID=UPI001CB76752|nr:DUF5360 family protein [Solihabitans fulvus]
MDRLMRGTKVAMLVTDVGFLVYWASTIAGLIPPELAYKDYTNPILSDWNFSFLVLDVAASVTGLLSLRRPETGRALMLVSLTLTSVAGLQAIAFWTLRGDFELTWWLPNLALLLFPLPAILVLTRSVRPDPAPTPPRRPVPRPVRRGFLRCQGD